ncbi:hypothetical protein N8823_05215 [Candidatus Pseudothioglobus singularis]|nr:hypothetical protein [Candidatus Pseudothioglobus singularis]
MKEAFKQFTNNVTSLGDDEITNHYSKLQSQADRGLLDEQLLKITPHNDPADLFEEFYKISLVKEEEPKPRYTDEEKKANISGMGRKFHNNLVWQTTLRLIHNEYEQKWSEKSMSIINSLINTEIFKKEYESAKKSKSESELDDEKYDSIWLDDNFFWYWLAIGCVNGMIATHYRVMLNTGMRTINALQARNIGEILAGSLNIERTDEVNEHLGHMAMTVVVTGDLPCEGNFEITSLKGTNFQAATIVSGENAPPIFDKVKFSKEPCVTMSKFYLASETPNKIEVTDNTLWALYWVFGVVKILFPKVGEKGWIENNGYSL